MKIRKNYIKSLIKRKSLKQKEIAVALGVKPQTLNNWMFRNVFPHFDKLEKLAEILEVSTDQIMIEEEISPLPTPIKEDKTAPQMPGAIPFYDLDGQSPLSILADEKSEIAPSNETYIPGISADLILPYYGTEMDPIITNGDLIALRKIDDHSFYNYGNLYLVTTQEQVIARYIKPSEKQNCIVLHAQNNSCDDIELPTNKITSMHAIVSTIKRKII